MPSSRWKSNARMAKSYDPPARCPSKSGNNKSWLAAHGCVPLQLPPCSICTSPCAPAARSISGTSFNSTAMITKSHPPIANPWPSFSTQIENSGCSIQPPNPLGLPSSAFLPSNFTCESVRFCSGKLSGFVPSPTPAEYGIDSPSPGWKALPPLQKTQKPPQGTQF